MSAFRVPILTGSVLPSHLRVREAYTAVIATVRIKISTESVTQKLTSKFTGARQTTNDELLDQLAALCPPEASLLLGLQITSSAQHFNDGTYLFLTGIATPVSVGSI